MEKSNTQTIAQLKKRCRELAATENISMVFSRKAETIVCKTEDTVLMNVNYSTKDNVLYVYFDVEKPHLPMSLFTFLLEYFVDAAKAEGCETVKFSMHETGKSLKSVKQEFILDAVLEAIGFKANDDSIFYDFHCMNNLNYISHIILSSKEIFKKFKEKEPSFEFNTSITLSQLEASDTNRIFSVTLISWRGYQGIVGFEKEGEEYKIKEVMNDIGNVNIELLQIVFRYKEIEKAINGFLEEIPSQMTLPNVLNTPHRLLKRLIYQVTKSEKIDALAVMQEFEELGYSFIEIEDEAGRMLSDTSYYHQKEYHPVPSYPLQFKQSIHNGILKFYRHYLILMSTSSYPDKAKYAIIDFGEKLEDAILRLSEDFEAELRSSK